MEIINNFITELLSKFDFQFMLVVNIATWMIIKTIDVANGTKQVPTWLKRLIAFIVGVIVGTIVVLTNSNSFITIFYSFFISLVSWDIIFKPILNRFGGILNYYKDNNEDNK